MTESSATKTVKLKIALGAREDVRNFADIGKTDGIAMFDFEIDHRKTSLTDIRECLSKAVSGNETQQMKNTDVFLDCGGNPVFLGKRNLDPDLERESTLPYRDIRLNHGGYDWLCIGQQPKTTRPTDTKKSIDFSEVLESSPLKVRVRTQAIDNHDMAIVSSLMIQNVPEFENILVVRQGSPLIGFSLEHTSVLGFGIRIRSITQGDPPSTLVDNCCYVDIDSNEYKQREKEINTFDEGQRLQLAIDGNLASGSFSEKLGKVLEKPEERQSLKPFISRFRIVIETFSIGGFEYNAERHSDPSFTSKEQPPNSAIVTTFLRGTAPLSIVPGGGRVDPHMARRPKVTKMGYSPHITSVSFFIAMLTAEEFDKMLMLPLMDPRMVPISASDPLIIVNEKPTVACFRGTGDRLLKFTLSTTTDATTKKTTTIPGNKVEHIGGHRTSSSPFVCGDYVYFRGTDNNLLRANLDGSGTAEHIGGHRTSSSPFVCGNYVYFQGTDNNLLRANLDGSGTAEHIGGHRTSSSPFVYKDYIYFQGTDNRLLRVKVDGSKTEHIGGCMTSSSPFVFNEYIYFRDRGSNQMCKCPVS